MNVRTSVTAFACAIALASCIGVVGCSSTSQSASSSSAAAESSATSQASSTAASTPHVEATIACKHNEDSGWVELITDSASFLEFGFEIGDSIDLEFSNGYKLEGVPLYTDSYVREYEPVAVAHKDSDAVVLKFNAGDDLWTVAGLQNEASPQVTITLRERGTYLDTEYSRKLTYTNNIANYGSETVFANFRAISGGKLRSNWIYRSASPIDNQNKRASYACDLAEEAGVKFFLNLSDNDDKIKEHCEASDFDSQYYADLFNAGNVKAVAMNFAAREQQFGEKVVAGLVAMSEHEGPYLIHCVEGKDRTGFVCILLEMLAGASLDEIRADYMLSYANYFGVTAQSRPGVYNGIVTLAFDPLVEVVTGAEPKADLSTYDLPACAEKYLLDHGMTEDQLAKLKSAILNE